MNKEIPTPEEKLKAMGMELKEEMVPEVREYTPEKFESLKEKLFKNFSLETLARKARVFLLGTLVVLSSIPREALARVITSVDHERGHFELVYEPEGKEREYLEAVPLIQIGYQASEEKLTSPLFEEIKKTDVKLKGVNYEIKDPFVFRDFVFKEAERISRELGINLERPNPYELILLASKIVQDNLKYEFRLDWTRSEYDRKLVAEINQTPLDKLIIEKKKGVCRHYAALFEKVFEELASIFSSPSTQNIEVDEVSSEILGHAYNVVFEIYKDKSEEKKIRIAFLDATFDDKTEKFRDNLDALSERHDSLENILLKKEKIPTFTLKEQLDILKGLREFYKDNPRRMEILIRASLPLQIAEAWSEENQKNIDRRLNIWENIRRDVKVLLKGRRIEELGPLGSLERVVDFICVFYNDYLWDLVRKGDLEKIEEIHKEALNSGYPAPLKMIIEQAIEEAREEKDAKRVKEYRKMLKLIKKTIK